MLQTIHNPRDISDHLRKHVFNITRIIEKESPTNKYTFQYYLQNSIRNSLSINAITKEEIQQQIKLVKKQ